MSRKTIKDIIKKKKNGERIVMLTAYDYPFAKIIDQCGVDIILVGDSLANVVLGLASTRQVGMAEMLHHTKAVNRAVTSALLVGDMPYRSYANPKLGVKNARRFVKESGCIGVKLEWFDRCPLVAQAIAKAGIPVMGHVGLTPQTAKNFKLQGKDAGSAAAIIRQAEILEEKGCFSVVLECVPDKIAGIITKKLKIPTIGIGAGPACDGQVLVTHDLLGLFKGFSAKGGSASGGYPKFVKKYANLEGAIKRGVIKFTAEVKKGSFPDRAHSYTISDEEFGKLNLML